MAMPELKNRPIHAIAQDLAAKSYTVGELVAEYINRIDQNDGVVKAFLKLDKERVMRNAEESDRRRATGNPLSFYDGIPIGVKDCIVTAGESCSCASKILEPVISPYDATVIAKLKSQGFIPFGRLNMDEFAMGSSCENSAFQKTTNPHDPQRVPGGSSGGSAACVGAGFAAGALGSDTGGSIRQPAAFCGIVGVKPTYGRVSRNGLVAFASSLDQIGPMTSDVEDAAILLDTIAGHDPLDSTSLPNQTTNFAEAVRNAPKSFKGVKIGLPKEYFTDGGLSSGVEKVLQRSIDKAKSLGAEIVEVSLPHTKYAVAVYYIIATAEASANLARFDGIRYGKRVNGKDLVDTYFQSRGEGFGDEVKRRILLGTYVLSSGYYDAYYLRAQKVRTLIRRDFEEAFKQCDVLLTPVTPTVAFKFGEKSDPLQMYLSDIFTIALNLSGNCGISIPAGIDSKSKMPVGLQLLAPAMAETKLLSFAQTLQQ
ncbi:MAG: Asp-tRNA(Asn)/Glu-tRNA(Gln) amidotransferase subunit GatA [Victivallales bacterium]|jgi:aspartyl-tRNA(Asn)/glutamyl-tRNA(Gln) amidotransferase subunit A|nr:Asp-tRNA(Asn)/Glu-tRNA(Gln) amidotransferase subunit GatA [Victivallales bacterium]